MTLDLVWPQSERFAIPEGGVLVSESPGGGSTCIPHRPPEGVTQRLGIFSSITGKGGNLLKMAQFSSE